MEETLQLSAANTTIKPKSEKEVNVWMALDALYTEDKLPFKSLTINKILMKRAVIEDGEDNRTKGDAQGVGEMKQRWAKARGVNSFIDPNVTVTYSNGSNQDPLIRASQLVRDQIKEELEEQYQNLLDVAEARAHKLDIELNASREQNEHIKQRIKTAETRLEELEPLYTKVCDAKTKLEAGLAMKAEDYSHLAASLENLQTSLKEQFEQQYQDKLQAKSQQIEELHARLTKQEQAQLKERDNYIITNEAQRTDYMKEKIDLNNQILNLKKSADRFAEIEADKKVLISETLLLKQELKDSEKQKDDLKVRLNMQMESASRVCQTMNEKLDSLLNVNPILVGIESSSAELNKMLKDIKHNISNIVPAKEGQNAD